MRGVACLQRRPTSTSTRGAVPVSQSAWQTSEFERGKKINSVLRPISESQCINLPHPSHQGVGMRALCMWFGVALQWATTSTGFRGVSPKSSPEAEGGEQANKFRRNSSRPTDSTAQLSPCRRLTRNTPATACPPPCCTRLSALFVLSLPPAPSYPDSS